MRRRPGLQPRQRLRRRLHERRGLRQRSFCDGAERCVAGDCFPAIRAADCNDGNMCTVDSCNDAAGGCEYEVADGCDAGVPTTDGGVAPPFDPTMHYAGNFLVAPAPSLGCPPSSYAVSSLTFQVVADRLEVQADRFTLIQSPVPTGADFAVSSNSDAQCSSVSITGRFLDANNLEATWNATCGLTCGTLERDIVGVRDE